MKALFWVQHLLGVGHVSRARAIVAAMAEAGIEVHVAFGGMPLAGARFEGAVHHLPPVRAADSAFSAILDERGNPVSRKTWDTRRAALTALHERVRPDAVLIEAWPFGRRAFAPELRALLDRHEGRAVASVRDILQARAPKRMRETVDHARRLQAVLVHADPALVRLEDTFALAGELSCEVVHTGFVAPGDAVRPAGEYDVLVSGGGGAFALPLFRVAVAAARLEPARHWTITLGPNGPEPSEVGEAANVTFVRRLDPLVAHMAAARVSVSQAGYNTVMDVLRAGVRSVLVPSDAGGQTEQSARAALLARAGRVDAIAESEVTPETLLAAVRGAPAPPEATYDMDGARETARWLRERLT